MTGLDRSGIRDASWREGGREGGEWRGKGGEGEPELYGEWKSKDEGIDLKHAEEEESEVLKHFHEEIPEEANIGSEVSHSETEGAQRQTRSPQLRVQVMYDTSNTIFGVY